MTKDIGEGVREGLGAATAAANAERALIVEWLRSEANYAAVSQAMAEAPTEKLYRMGQKDALRLAVDGIESGFHDATPIACKSSPAQGEGQ